MYGRGAGDWFRDVLKGVRCLPSAPRQQLQNDGVVDDALGKESGWQEHGTFAL
jgi:hypothetical protein